MRRRNFIASAFASIFGLSMATARPTVRSCASGGVIAAGRHRLPAWVPAVGAIADVALNTMYDVRGTGVKTAGMLDDWCGIAYAPEYGDYGSLIAHGGGHSDSQENGIYRYDIATRLHSKIKNDATSYVHVDGYNADPVTGWMWAAVDGTAVQVGEPFATHNYAFLLALPSTAIPGGGAPNGWLFTPGRDSMPATGSAGTSQSHKIALGVDSVWSAHGSPLSFSARHSFALYDPTRNCIVNAHDNGFSYRKVWTFDLDTGIQGEISFPSDPFMTAYYAIGKYNALHDLYMAVRWNGALALSIVDPVTSRHYLASASGTPPTGVAEVSTAWEWVEAWQSFVMIAASTNTIWTLKAPADPRTGTWLWGSYTLTGTVRPPALNAPCYTRIRYVPQLDGFMWAPRHNVPFQMFRIPKP